MVSHEVCAGGGNNRLLSLALLTTLWVGLRTRWAIETVEAELGAEAFDSEVERGKCELEAYVAVWVERVEWKWKWK